MDGITKTKSFGLVKNFIKKKDKEYIKTTAEEILREDSNKKEIVDNKNNIYKLQLEQNNKEMASIKNQLKMTQTNYMNFPFKKIK